MIWAEFLDPTAKPQFVNIQNRKALNGRLVVRIGLGFEGKETMFEV
jgi:hypothetical protein